MHHPVLLKETIEGLNIKKDGLYIDATVGEGGHLMEIVKQGGKVLGIDWDDKQIKNLILRHPEFISSRLTRFKDLLSKNKMLNQAIVLSDSERIQHDIRIVQGNFSDIEKIAKTYNFFPVDGILFDLGLSIEQIEISGRGFSYHKANEPLDMRISSNLKITAADIVNSFNQAELYEILASYSEDINSLAISQAIVRTRAVKKIITVGDLLKIINEKIGIKDNRTNARIFQALRIAVNREFDNLKTGLNGALNILKNNGRIVVISFHSLEDRIVKQFAKKNNLKQINKKVIKGNRDIGYERSAKLRVLVK